MYNCWKNGVTGSSGTVYLECLISAELSEGLLFMEASMTDTRYTVISSQNTWSNYQTHIYPLFDVGVIPAYLETSLSLLASYPRVLIKKWFFSRLWVEPHI